MINTIKFLVVNKNHSLDKYSCQMMTADLSLPVYSTYDCHELAQHPTYNKRVSNKWEYDLFIERDNHSHNLFKNS